MRDTAKISPSDSPPPATAWAFLLPSESPPCRYFDFKALLSRFAARWINARLNATMPPDRSTALFPAILARFVGFTRLFPVRTAACSACPAPPTAVRRRQVLTITAGAALEAPARIPSEPDHSGPASESRTMPKNSCPDRQSPARPSTSPKSASSKTSCRPDRKAPDRHRYPSDFQPNQKQPDTS